MAKMLQLHNMNLNVERFDTTKTWQFFRELGLIDGNYLHVRNYANVKGVWEGKPAYIIGAAPSLRHTLEAVGGWEFFKGKHTIGINHLVEDWDGFEWLFFLDKRFLDTTSYDVSKFKGVIFAQCTTGLKPDENHKIFYTHRNNVTTRLEDGLYGTLSGVAAVNLALISGADPIYLFGLDPGASPITPNNLHYKKGYTGEKGDTGTAEKFKRIMKQFDVFQPYQKRLRLVTDGGKWIPWMTREKIKRLGRVRIQVKPRDAKIVHLSFSDDIKRHADITRYICQECPGKHSLVDVRSGPIPDADLYFAEHFLSTSGRLNALPDDVKRRSINIVHTMNCIPQGPWKRVIALTEAWRRWLRSHQVKVDRVIIPGIDLEPYKNITPNYAGKVFGRLTRWRPGKIHPEWNDITLQVLDAVPGSKSIIFTEKNEDPARPFLKDARVKYDSRCKIDMFKGDFLKELSVYVHVNGSFKETLSFAVIEAMAAGLPVIYLSEGTGVLEEVVAGCGIVGDDIAQVRDFLIAMLNDPEYAEEYGRMAKENAKRFDKNRMVKEFTEEIEECLK